MTFVAKREIPAFITIGNIIHHMWVLFYELISFHFPVVYGRQNTRVCGVSNTAWTVPPGCLWQKLQYELTSNFR
jgi:hypothetical protein